MTSLFVLVMFLVKAAMINIGNAIMIENIPSDDVQLLLGLLALLKKEEQQHKQYEMSFQIPKKIHECC